MQSLRAPRRHRDGPAPRCGRPGCQRSLATGALLLAAAILTFAGQWTRAAAAEPPTTPRLHVTVEQGRLTVDLWNARLVRVLRLIGERAGVTMRFRGDPNATLTQSFAGVPIEEGLRRLLQGHSLVLVYAPTGKGGAPVLTEVSVVPPSLAAAPRSRADGAPRAAGRHADTLGLAPSAAAASGPGRASSDAQGPEAPDGAARSAPGGAGDRAARLEVAQALARQGDAEAGADLARILAEDAHPLVRAQAAALLGIVGGEPAATALAAAVADGDAAVRLHAVRALGKVEGAAAVPVLRDVLRRDPDPRVRRVAVRWLAALPGDDALAAVQAAGSDSDPGVREAAATALTTRGKQGR